MWLQLALLSLWWPLRLSYLQFAAFYLMAESDHVNRNQSQCIYIHGLSWCGLCQGKCLLVLLPFDAIKVIIPILDKLTSRPEEMQNSFSLFISLCKNALDLEREINIVKTNKNGNHCVEWTWKIHFENQIYCEVYVMIPQKFIRSSCYIKKIDL